MNGPVIDGKGWANGPIAFLDRDGVLNYGREGYVNNPSQMNIIPGSGHAIAQLRESGFTICVVTNQSPIMRGLWDVDQLHTIHEELRKQLLNENKDAVIDMILTCPHRNRDRCGCRKPWPGMLRTGHELLRDQRVLHSNKFWRKTRTMERIGHDGWRS